MEATEFKVEGSEARKFPRIAFTGIVHLNDPDKDEDEADRVRACDLSLGGMSLEAPSALGPGRAVDVDFLERNMRVRGVTRHEVRTSPQNGWRIGIQFADPQPELVEVILRLASG